MRDPNSLYGYFVPWNFDAKSTYGVDSLFLVSLFFYYEKRYGQMMKYCVNPESGFTVFLQTMEKDGIVFPKKLQKSSYRFRQL